MPLEAASCTRQQRSTSTNGLSREKAWLLVSCGQELERESPKLTTRAVVVRFTLQNHKLETGCIILRVSLLKQCRMSHAV